MPLLALNIDSKNKIFILSGDLTSIKSNRQGKFYLEDTLKARFDQNKLLIPYDEALNKEIHLNKIRTALKKYNIDFEDSEEIIEELDTYYKSELEFELFSKKAKGIWNNEIDLSDFYAFKISLEKNLPNRILYDKQMLAAFHLAFSQNACNFSVPGSGKTSVVYGAYSYLKNLPINDNKYINKILIIGPLSSFGPWEDEYESCFGVRALSKRLSGGISKDARDEHLLSILNPEDTPEILLMSYHSISFNLSNIITYLKKIGNNVMIVLDEAHKIKNVQGGTWANSVLELAKYSKSRVVLTGTPIPNGFEDLYNLYNFIWPNKNILKFNLFQLKDMSTNRYDGRIDQLIDNISPFFIRIRKSDLGLPEATENSPIVVPMGVKQRHIYDFLEANYIEYFSHNLEQVPNALSKLTKARFIRLLQAATNPNLLKRPIENYLDEGESLDGIFLDDTEILSQILNYGTEEIPSKFIAVANLVREILVNNEKVIIWATFIQTIKELKEYLQNLGIEVKLLIGEIPVELDNPDPNIETRESIIKDFHNPNSQFNVIIANPFVVAESISLHKACHNAIYLERNFNAAIFLQSKDRIHRVGLNPSDKTNYYYILSEDSIDETIHSRLNEKEARMLTIIESEAIPLINMNMDYEEDSADDIKALIKDYVRRSDKI